MNLDETIRESRRALGDFTRGNPATYKALWSHRDDVILANPFVGRPACGWTNVAQALDYASSRLRDGKLIEYTTISKIEGRELAFIVEIEEWKVRVVEQADVSPSTLRVTTVFRSEDGAWKIVHRHADPLSRPDASGPLRPS
jgi:ketosteroid isomerase-like protein